MSTSFYFSSAKMQQRLHEGPLGIHIDLYAARLQEEGHCRQSAWRCLRVVCDFSHWLDRKRFTLSDVDEQVVKNYERFRSRYRHPFLSDARALKRLLELLRSVNVIPEPITALSPCEKLIADFRRHLSSQRGLTHVSITRHEPVVRRFLKEACNGEVRRLSKLAGADIITFIEQHAPDHSPRSAQIMCNTLRTFSRYLQYTGKINTDLAAAVPTIRRWKLATLPTYLSSEQLQQVLRCCDRQSAIGRRDFAILMMLAQLGLRANEVATLTLDDIDWQDGTLTIQAKGRWRTQVPLLPDVAAAIIAYLQRGRPVSCSRRLFLRSLAPHTGFASSAGISMIAKTAVNAHLKARFFDRAPDLSLLASSPEQSGGWLSETTCR